MATGFFGSSYFASYYFGNYFFGQSGASTGVDGAKGFDYLLYANIIDSNRKRANNEIARIIMAIDELYD